MGSRRLLLISNSTQKPISTGGYLKWCQEFVKDFFSKYDVKKVLFVPYAIRDHDGYEKKVKTAFQRMGIEVESIHQKSNPVEAVKACQGIFIGGGNTFLLLKTLYDHKLLEPLREAVLQRSVPYMGVSAGTNVATVSICTTNDMPIVYPPSFEALRLVPFNINPHYVDADEMPGFMGESREERISEYHQVPSSPPVLGLRECSLLRVEDGSATLQGLCASKLFQSGNDPIVYNPEDDLSFLLKI